MHEELGLKFEELRSMVDNTFSDSDLASPFASGSNYFDSLIIIPCSISTLNKIASGGERSRLLLALRAVLATADPVPTLIFDEVDAGVGGAVSSAVGKRLKKLGINQQVLVVTHSPQVAALGLSLIHI